MDIGKSKVEDDGDHAHSKGAGEGCTLLERRMLVFIIKSI